MSQADSKLSGMGTKGRTMFDWLYTAVSWVLLRWHDLWALVLPGVHHTLGTDWDWLASIVSLVFTIRLLFLPLYIGQLRSQRAMKALQPRIAGLQKEHKGDRQALQAELVKLYQTEKVNPLTGCLPMLLQIPVFFGIFHVINRLDPLQTVNTTLYGWTQPDWDGAAAARFFGAPIGAQFSTSVKDVLAMHASEATVTRVAAALVAAMCAFSFLSGFLMIREAGWSHDRQQRLIQRLTLVGIPAASLIAGWWLPIGVMVYWISQSAFTIGQIRLAYRRLMRGFQPTRNAGNTGEMENIDGAVAAVRAGRAISADRVPGGDRTLVVLREVYSSQQIRSVDPPSRVDSVVALWVTAWLYGTEGIYCPGSGRVHPSDVDEALPFRLRWDAGLHGRLAAALLNLANDNEASAATRSLAAHVVLSVPATSPLPGDRPSADLLLSLATARSGPSPRTVNAARQDGDPVDWLIRVVRTEGATNPVLLADQLERDQVKGPIGHELVSWFGMASLWSDHRSPVLRQVLRRSQLRSFKSVAEILAYDTGRRRRPRVGASDEAYLDELVTCVTRRYVAEFHRDRVGFVRWYNRQITLYVFAKECRRLARTKQLRSSADLLVAAIAPAIRLLQQAEGHARAKDAPAARRARNKFLVHSLWLLPVAAGLGEFYRVFPGPVSVILGPLVLGGLVHAARRNAKYKLYLSWAIAAPSALVFDLLLHIGVIEAPSRLRLLTLLATHNGGWTWWVYIGQLAYGALCLTVALRAPWTRARLTVGAAFDQDNALPGGIKDDIDDAVNGAVLGDGPPPQAPVAHDRRRTPRVNR